MTYSYTQISQYLSCPRRYRHRYLDGWQEKDTRGAMLFGRAFEQAVAAIGGRNCGGHSSQRTIPGARVRAGDADSPGERIRPAGRLDRKSTRLNSSHLGIA